MRINRCHNPIPLGFLKVFSNRVPCPIVFLALLAACLVTTPLFPAAEASTSVGNFPFYAVYDRVADFKSLNMEEIYNALFSPDGNRIVIYGRSRETAQLALFVLNTDGGNVTEIILPQELNGIREASINEDGSRVFLLHAWSGALYKLESGLVSKVFDAKDYGQVNGIDQIQTTADGDWVYFRDPRHSIWRVSHGGGVPTRLIQEKEVRRDGGVSSNIGLFRISSDGKTIAFTINGYWDERGVYHEKQEVFVRRDGATKQLTKDRRNIFKERLSLSGNGNVIAYTASQPQGMMWSIHADGSLHRSLEKIVSVGPIGLNYDGSRLYYYDQANGGRLTYTDGSGGIDIFPRYNVGSIALQAPFSLAVSNLGDRIGFRFNDGVYVGHIGHADAVAGAPVIESIKLYPPVTTPALAQQGTTLRASISDPQGVVDIIRTQTNELLAGSNSKSNQNVPVFFYHPVNDAGAPPDQEKGDGIFSSSGQPGGKPEAIADTRIRVAAMDNSYTVVVADAPLTGAELGVVSSPSQVASKGLEIDTNRPGSDYRNFSQPSADPKLCQQACENDPICVAFTYVKPNIQGPSARCWLKNRVPPAVEDACCVSGLKKGEEKDSETQEAETPGMEPPVGKEAAVAGGPKAIRLISDEQRDVLRLYGLPDTFEMALQEDADQAGKLAVLESWRYYEYYSSFEFVDGRLVENIRIEGVPTWTLTARRYTPVGLRLGMHVSQVKQALGNQELVSAPMPERFGKGLVVYTADQILLGFADDVLVYAGTFALSVGEGQQ